MAGAEAAKKKRKKKTKQSAPVDWARLAKGAEAQRANAYAPYSGYRVGALLAARSTAGPVQYFAGANIENASYGLCVCAERVAAALASLRGARDFVAIAVATEGPEAGPPCGMCRQVLAEFADDMEIALVVRGKIARRTTLRELLPGAFRPAMLPSKSKRA